MAACFFLPEQMKLFCQIFAQEKLPRPAGVLSHKVSGQWSHMADQAQLLCDFPCAGLLEVEFVRRMIYAVATLERRRTANSKRYSVLKQFCLLASSSKLFPSGWRRLMEGFQQC